MGSRAPGKEALYHVCASTTLHNSQIINLYTWSTWIRRRMNCGFCARILLNNILPIPTHWVVGLMFSFCINHSCIYGLQNFTAWVSKLRASPPHTGKYPFSLNLAARWRKSCCSPMILMDHFAAVILTPFKSLFLLWIRTVSITRPDVKT